MTATVPGSDSADLLARLSEPKNAALLHSIVDRLEIIDVALQGVDGLLKRGEVIADSLGETIRDAAGLGASAHRTAPASASTNGQADGAPAEKLDPVEALQTLTKLAPKLLRTLESLEPALGSKALDHMAQPRVLDALARLASSKVLEPEVVDSVGQVGEALLATKKREASYPSSLGLFGMMRAMGDPDAKRALGFFATFLKEYGRRLG